MEEKSLHFLALERLQSALDNFDTSFIVSNKLFRLALVSEILDTTCLFEQLYNAWSEKLPLGEGPDVDVDFQYWKSLNQWNNLIDNAQQNVCINDVTYSLGNGMTSDDISGNKRKNFKKNLTAAFKHADFSDGKIVADFLTWVEADKSGSLTYGNILFGALQSLLSILNKINNLLGNPPSELLKDYCVQQKERFATEYERARNHINQICTASYPIKRKQNQLRGYCDDLKESLVKSEFLYLIGGDFTKYDIDDYRAQTGNQNLSDDEVISELILDEVLSEYNGGRFNRLNNFLYRNRKELSKNAVSAFFVYAELLPLLESKICEYENIMVYDKESQAEGKDNAHAPKYPFVTDADSAEEVIAKIKSYQKGKSTPKDVAQPVRAAIDAGAIRRPSHAEYQAVEGFASIPKSSFSDYTNPDKTPYFGENYETIVKDFKTLVQK